MTMSIELKLTFSTIAEAVAFLTKTDAAATAAVSVAGNEKPAKETKPTKAAKGEAAGPATSTVTTSSEKPSAEAAPADDAPAVKYEDLQAEVMKVVALGDAGKTKLREILAGFGIPTFKGSDEAIWPAALAKVKAAHDDLSVA